MRAPIYTPSSHQQIVLMCTHSLCSGLCYVWKAKKKSVFFFLYALSLSLHCSYGTCWNESKEEPNRMCFLFTFNVFEAHLDTHDMHKARPSSQFHRAAFVVEQVFPHPLYGCVSECIVREVARSTYRHAYMHVFSHMYGVRPCVCIDCECRIGRTAVCVRKCKNADLN